MKLKVFTLCSCTQFFDQFNSDRHAGSATKKDQNNTARLQQILNCHFWLFLYWLRVEKELHLFIAPLHLFCRTIGMQPDECCIRQEHITTEKMTSESRDDEKRCKKNGADRS